MIIAVASGKGGTGKTTVATSLALVLAEHASVEFLDCDAEEPNAHFFLHPDIITREPITVPVPQVDEETCTLCGRCGEACQFKAIAVLQDTVLVFPELCHGCTACWELCPVDAITAIGREIGVAEDGTADGIAFHHGWLRVGEAMSPPLIRAVKKRRTGADFTVIDAPPGTSCPVVESVRQTDAVVLVTEPTPFGLNDLELAADMAAELGVPTGVVVNRAGIGDDAVYRFCQERGLPVWLDIPFDRRVAEAYSRGVPLIDAAPKYGALLHRLADHVLGVATV